LSVDTDEWLQGALNEQGDDDDEEEHEAHQAGQTGYYNISITLNNFSSRK